MHTSQSKHEAVDVPRARLLTRGARMGWARKSTGVAHSQARGTTRKRRHAGRPVVEADISRCVRALSLSTASASDDGYLTLSCPSSPGGPGRRQQPGPASLDGTRACPATCLARIVRAPCILGSDPSGRRCPPGYLTADPKRHCGPDAADEAVNPAARTAWPGTCRRELLSLVRSRSTDSATLAWRCGLGGVS